MSTPLLSKYTSSLIDPETLEALFVQRERLAKRLVDLVVSDAGSKGRHHTLMVGPRGIGKTFLITLLHNRISAIEDLKDKILISWLKEEEWGVTSYTELVISILKALRSEKNEWLANEIDSLYDLDPDKAEKKAEELLVNLAEGRMLLLLMENLDMIFEDIGEEGQKKLRAFIQEKGLISIIATSQGLFDGVSRQKFPFYGTFQINHLECLTIDEALLLLEKMAKERKDEKLAEYLKTSAARARVRAVMHLSGGNHRIMAMFSQFLTYESLEELVKPFMEMIDELTPYYQSKMKELPAQQRKLVDFLCGFKGAAQVKEIAKKCFLTHQAASSQLKGLKEKGYVVSRSIGRDSYYELAEPLMRLCVEVKAHRTGPVKLLIDLLRIWYSADDLEKRVEFLKGKGKGVDFEYACHALNLCRENPDHDLVIDACRDYFATHLKNGKIEEATEVLNDLDAARTGASEKILSDYPEYTEYKSNIENGRRCINEQKYEESVVYYEKACELIPAACNAFIFKGLALDISGKKEEALEALGKACGINPDNFNAWYWKGRVLGNAGRYQEAIEAYSEACILKNDDFDSWFFKGTAQYNTNKYDEAADAFSQACELKPDSFEAWYWKGNASCHLGKNEEAVEAYEMACNIHPDNYQAWFWKGVIFGRLNKFPQAIEAFDKACDIEPDNFEAWLYKGLACGDAGKWSDTIAALEKALSIERSNLDTDLSDVKYISLILLERFNHKEWQEKANELTTLFKNHEFLDLLSSGLLESLEKALDPITSDLLAKEWLAAWENAAGSEPEFDIPLRIFRSGLRYREKPDERILMDHPVEERMILEEIMEKAGIYKRNDS